jgi:MFS family permease
VTVRGLAGARSLRAFSHRNFRLFYVGQAISLVGSWMQAVAQSWLVLVLTNDPLMLGLLAAAQWLPVLFLGLFGGLIADALPKRQTLVVVESLMGVLAIVLGLLTLTGVVEVWMVLLLAVFLGCLNAVEMPVRQAFAVELVGREDIVNAVALNSALFNGARVVGPAVAGLAIAAFDISIAFLVNGVSYVAVVAALLLMRDADLHLRPPIARPHTAREVVASVGEGVGYVRSTPLVLFAVVTVGLAATIGMNFQVTIAPFARDSLGGDASTFGFLMTASGLGSVTAALFLATRRRPSARAIGVGALGLGAGLVVASLLPVFGLALVAMFVAGAGAIWMAANGNTLIQATVPDELRGRVMSVYTTVFAGSTPVGGIIAGALASALGAAAAIGIGGAATIVVGAVALAWLRRHRMRAAVAAGRPPESAAALPAPGHQLAPEPAGQAAPPVAAIAASPAALGTLLDRDGADDARR